MRTCPAFCHGVPSLPRPLKSAVIRWPEAMLMALPAIVFCVSIWIGPEGLVGDGELTTASQNIGDDSDENLTQPFGDHQLGPQHDLLRPRSVLEPGTRRVL